MFSKLTSSLKLHVAALTMPDFTLPHWSLPELSAADWRTLAVLGFFVLLLVLEAPRARREQRPALYRQSYLANIGTLFLNDTLMSLLSASSLWLVAEHYARWGLLSHLPDSGWKAVLSFVLLDLTLYAWHRANHSFDALWMFHKVHHSDPTMNVSTAFRLHAVEVLLTLWVKALFIVVVGVDSTAVVANEAVITLFVMFHHAHLKVPGERWLAWLAIVPALHRVHHSARREEHDRNYGAVLSLWDRCFGTLAELQPAEIGLRRVAGMNALQLLKYGLTWQTTPTIPRRATTGAEARTLLELVRLGLTPAPNAKHNRYPLDRTRHDRPGYSASRPDSVRAMIAEAAYYRAEKRGFVPGYECLDWLEAEREITRRTHTRHA